MKISDLYPVAKLDYQFDDQEFIKIKFTKDIEDFFEKFSDIFLIFKDYRVRYVTIEDVKYDHGFKIKLFEKELKDEIIKDGKVKVFLEAKDVPDLPKSLLYTGFDVYSDDEYIGEVTGILESKLQNVFLIELKNGKEINIPDVDFFVDEVDIEKRIIQIKNYKELLTI